MKSKFSSVVLSTLLAASALLAVQVRAEDGPGGPPPTGEKQMRPEKGRMPGGGERLEKMKEHLGLSDEQTAQLKAIWAEEAKELKALRGDDTGPTPEKREQMRAIREKYRAQIEAVLTPEQREKMAAAREKRQEGQHGPKGPKDGQKPKGPKGEKGDKPAPSAAE